MLKKAGVLAAGVLAALLLCEAALRINSRRHRASPADARAAKAGAGGLRILCLGDSFTYGLGAPRGEGYPDHLQGLLDSRFGAGKFDVINGGLLGINSSQLEKKLPDILRKHDPGLVLVMIGNNNDTLLESNIFLFVPDLLGLKDRTILRADVLLSGLKTYKLLKLLLGLVLGGRDAPEEDGAPEGCRAGARELVNRGAESFGRQDYQTAKTLLTRAVAEDGACGAAYFQLGYVTYNMGDTRAAFDLLKKAKALGYRHHLLQPLLSQELPLLRPDEFRILLDKVLEYDLRSICRGVVERGAVPVLIAYPYSDAPRDGVRRRVAGEFGAPFVLRQAAFDAPSRRYFSGDNPRLMFSHLNSAGYKVFAEGVFAVLRRDPASAELFREAR